MGIWNWDYYYNHTCFMKLGGAFETEDNNQAWLSPMKYPMSSGWRNTKTKVEFVLPASKAIMFLFPTRPDRPHGRLGVRVRVPVPLRHVRDRVGRGHDQAH